VQTAMHHHTSYTKAIIQKTQSLLTTGRACPTYGKCQIDFIASTTSNKDSKGEIRKTNGDKFLKNKTRRGKKFANQVLTGMWTKQVRM